METFASTTKSYKHFAERFTIGQKAVMLVGLALLAAIIFVVSTITSQPTYGVLFTNLSASDAGAITAKLSSAGVPYRLTDSGSVIEVPENMVDQERIAMAEAGLPANSAVGLSLLSNVGTTTSQIAQQADYQAALQGQLEQTIEAINGVQNAQVNLALPLNSTAASGGNQTPTASVIVTLANGVQLSATQVQGIVHLVASAISGMNANGITVVDQNGNVLAAPSQRSASVGSLSGTQSYDVRLEASIESMLTSVLGPNQANVRVAATLNLNKINQSSQQIATTKGKPQSALTHSQTQTQTYTGTGAAPPAGTGTKSAYNQKSVNNSYAVGQIDQTVVQPPGQLQRLSVAVVVNSKAKPAYSLAKIKTLVASAVGIVPKRGDTLSVTALPFATQPTSVPGTQSPFGSIFSLAKIGLLVLGVLIVILLMARSSRKAAAEQVMVSVPESPIALEDSRRAVHAISTRSVQPVVSDEILDYIDKQPNDVTGLLRLWTGKQGRP
ncbi:MULTISPECIES: flagellar basal-body MS-ring/collar protein FliF [Ferrimicrobium]|uniref:flagellar basal-body MS-ring/collar protein FliF n=1 Tax=Ferrimicrobium TaxID=121038 RepID=UPI0023F11E7A|nr:MULTISPECIES: flagellar basal-body MS-ring/collar protein FliF [Ferrimicrobium]